ncbi:MAG: TRAP transporter substrate-binding protein [Alphaproteobacteria bacterium]|nr:TRAP transporter substrate-binding protein [Alphaproteobacteria bacterium]
MVAGSVYGTDAQMAEDLATVLDDGATRRILPVVGKGSLQNLLDLRALRGADLAIVQVDVLDEVRARRTHPGIENAVSYIAKLYNVEFHLLARANIKTIADLAGKNVSVGGEGDGTAVTASRVFDLLKVKVEGVAYDPMLALEKLKAGEIDAMAYVSAKPAPLFAMLRPQDGLHFVAIPLQPNVAAAYIPARLAESDYPALVTAQGPVDTVAVGTVLLAANLTVGSDRYRNVANFVEVFFTQFPKLLESPRHPKWNEVNLAAELPNWHRFGPADAWIKRNGGAPTMVNDQQLHDIFAKFLDERSKAAGQAMSAAQKDELFDQFKRWQSSKTP